MPKRSSDLLGVTRFVSRVWIRMPLSASKAHALPITLGCLAKSLLRNDICEGKKSFSKVRPANTYNSRANTSPISRECSSEVSMVSPNTCPPHVMKHLTQTISCKLCLEGFPSPSSPTGGLLTPSQGHHGKAVTRHPPLSMALSYITLSVPHSMLSSLLHPPPYTGIYLLWAQPR